jgi:stage V sporulation protein R
MAALYDVEDLRKWNDRIVELVDRFGLDCYPQEFELCNHNDMLAYMAYSGMPSHYPHWSYGKGFERLKTLYEYGVSGLPYEMVINSNPSIAYLMRDNSLALQVLTIAHVYGHNDFFKNNFTFQSTRAEFTIETFKSHANRVRHYVEDPSIGLEKVEAILDAAHAVSLQCRRNLAIRKPTAVEEQQMKIEEATPPSDPFGAIHRRRERPEQDLSKVPLYPDEDLLIFHSRPQSQPCRMGQGSFDHRPRRGSVLRAAARHQDYERRMGEFLAQENPRSLKPAPGAASGISRASFPGAAPFAGKSQPVPYRFESLGRYRKAMGFA